MGDRPMAWIGKELSCSLGAALAVGFAALATPGVALSEEQSLQFMIAGGVAVQVVDARRHIINRRRVMANDAIRFAQLVSRLQFQPRDAGGVDSHQVQPSRWHL